VTVSENKGYFLVCPRCNSNFKDNGYKLICDSCIKEEIRVILKFAPLYSPEINKNVSGLARYYDFLPAHPSTDIGVLLKTIRSNNFAKKYGFKKLFFTCTGYSQKLNINCVTASFKELEAISVLNRLIQFKNDKPLLLSSAGNTARAFSYHAAKYHYPVIIIIPGNSRNYLWLPDENGLHENVRKYVKAIFVEQPGTYFDASSLARLISIRLGKQLVDEGGLFNVGRMCGLGLCAINFYDEIEEFPDHYIQAVGSAAGPLSALRAYEMLDKKKALTINYHIVQNYPYTPLADAIENNRDFSSDGYLHNIDTACAPMLTSGDSALNYPGGIKEEMNLGTVFRGYRATNEEIYEMQYEFWKLENLQIGLPAAAALVGLLKAKAKGRINSNDITQVNITGLGDLEIKRKNGFFYIPSLFREPVKQNICSDKNKFNSWFKEELLVF